MIFADRYEAGKKLAKKLARYAGRKDIIILAIPRGALQIGAPIARALRCPLDIFVSKKIPAPGNEEFAIGAVSQEGVVDVDDDTIREYGEEYIQKQVKRLKGMVKEKYTRYTGKKQPPSLTRKVVILCDDGIATGHTMKAAARAIRKLGPARIIIAAPVAPPQAVRELEEMADEVIVLSVEENFFAIGNFYASFPQVEDEEAIRILREARK
ncbi:phosphoribosyltransferase [Candidatus Woesearchaeota archaeon]|nr:phosphoribosyltransferase [Candidatus Woesearchaeota archaeon]